MAENPENSFTSIAGEGNDGSGKNTAVLTILEHVVENESVDVILTNFPQYFLPSGFLVRSMLRGAGDDYLEMMDATPEQELNLRMAMFQLDRIVAWGVLENYRNSHQNVLHISDRLGMSQVNTWAFLTAKYNGKILEEDAETLLKLALKSDAELYRRFKPQTVVFSAGQENCGVNRVELDQYERKDAVARAEGGYMTGADVYNNSGRPATVVRTKDDEGSWRNRHEIADEALRSVGFVPSQLSGEAFDLYEAVKSGRLTVVGPLEFLRTYCPDYDIDSNNELKQAIEGWLQVSLIPEIAIPQSGKTKKEILDEIETNLAYQIDKIMEEQKVFPLRAVFGDSFGLVKEAVLRLATENKDISLERFLTFLCDKKGLTRSYARLVLQFLQWEK